MKDKTRKGYASKIVPTTAGKKEEIWRATAVGGEGAPAAVRGMCSGLFHLCHCQEMDVLATEFVAARGTNVDPKKSRDCSLSSFMNLCWSSAFSYFLSDPSLTEDSCWFFVNRRQWGLKRGERGANSMVGCWASTNLPAKNSNFLCVCFQLGKEWRKRTKVGGRGGWIKGGLAAWVE